MTETVQSLSEVAGRLVGRTSLVEVRMFSHDAKFVSFPEGETDVALGLGDIGVNISPGQVEEGAPSVAYMLNVTVDVEERRDGEEPSTIVSTETAFGALYMMEDGLDATADELRAFGILIASLALWPYVRAHLAGTFGAMGFPVEPLGLLTQAEVVEAMRNA